MDSAHLFFRKGVWCFRRRVPADLAELDPRIEIWRSTKTSHQATAVVVASKFNDELEAFWRALRDGDAVAGNQKAFREFDRAVRIARALGIAYRPISELAAGDLDEIVQRIAALQQKNLTESKPAAAAILGTVEKPALLISELFAFYEGHARDQLRGKSEDQVRKWKNPRKHAIANLLAVIGDKPIAKITRDDGLEFRSWWLDRVLEEDYDPGSANKNIGQLQKMFHEVNQAKRLGLVNPFSSLRLAGERHNPRIPYDEKFVRDNLLAGSRLDRLNPEARGITVMVATTGMRPSEIAGLTGHRIVLHGDMPFVRVFPENRQLKTRHSRRDMPLVGRALEIMQEFPDGFPRYRENPDTLSATVNKALGEAGLRPTPEHTLYSLRHTFKDRLISIEAPERVQDALMGHAVREVEYGKGPSLEQKATWLARVWGS